MTTAVDHIILGLVNSLRFDRAIWLCLTNREVAWKLFAFFQWNYFLIIFPHYLVHVAERFVDAELEGMGRILFNLLVVVLYFCSLIVNAVLCFDLSGCVNKVAPVKFRTSRPQNARDMFEDPVSVTFMITAFQMIVLILAQLINLIPLPYVECLSFVILCYYHSFAYFNLISTLKGYAPDEQMVRFERNWVYYLGYGTLVTTLGVFSSVGYGSNYVDTFAYNLYSALLIVISFLVVPPPPLPQGQMFQISLRPCRVLTAATVHFANRLVLRKQRRT